MNSSEKEEGDVHLYDVPTSLVIFLSLLYGAISLAAFVGNSLVIYVVSVSPRMRTVTNFYIANMAFADVTIALFAIPFQVGRNLDILGEYRLLDGEAKRKIT